jgi:dienelactone hydrolase
MRTLLPLVPLVALALAVPATAAPTTTEMSLTSSDGFVLKGTLTLPTGKGKAPVVILAHQFGADRTGWAPLVDKLQARGIGTLALDLRGHGASTQKGETSVKVDADFLGSAKVVGFDRIPGDLAQAAAWLRKQPGVDTRRLGMAGSSVGAFSVLMAASDVKPVAVLSLSPAGTGAFGEGAQAKLKDAVLRGRASVLVMAASKDKDAFDNAAVLKDLPGVDLGLVEGEEHGFDFFKGHSETMAVFFGEYLTYHHTGKTYAVSAPKKPAANPNVITDKTVAEKKAAEAPK